MWWEGLKDWTHASPQSSWSHQLINSRKMNPPPVAGDKDEQIEVCAGVGGEAW